MRFKINDYSVTADDKGWGNGWPDDRFADMARVTADRSGVAVNLHKGVARLADLLLDETERRGYLFEQHHTGGFCCRQIRNTGRPSNHSWGLAIDVNWTDNPAGRGPMRTNIPSWMPRLWARYGWYWGGLYGGSFKDPMHFEFMGAPADARDMTNQAIADGIGTLPLTDADKQWLKEELRDAVNAHADTLFRWADHGGGDPPDPSPPDHRNNHKAILDRLDALERRLQARGGPG
jgi:hypothetical protein